MYIPHEVSDREERLKSVWTPTPPCHPCCSLSELDIIRVVWHHSIAWIIISFPHLHVNLPMSKYLSTFTPAILQDDCTLTVPSAIKDILVKTHCWGIASRPSVMRWGSPATILLWLRIYVANLMNSFPGSPQEVWDHPSIAVPTLWMVLQCTGTPFHRFHSFQPSVRAYWQERCVGWKSWNKWEV